MKLLISLCITITFLSKANAMILIEHDQRIKNAEQVEEILNSKYQIPKILIDIKSGKCRKSLIKKIAHLCIKKDGELIINDFEENIIELSLSAFRN
jgi:thiamine monophosphate synthase